MRPRLRYKDLQHAASPSSTQVDGDENMRSIGSVIMRFTFSGVIFAIAAFLAGTAPAQAADNIDCAIEALEIDPEYMLIGYENLLAFGDPKQPFAKSGSQAELDMVISECARKNAWNKQASKLAAQFTIASATISFIEFEMSQAGAPEDFGKDLYNDMSNAELKTLRKTGKLSAPHSKMVASAMAKYFGAKPKKGVKDFFYRWPQMLEDRDVSSLAFIKIKK